MSLIEEETDRIIAEDTKGNLIYYSEDEEDGEKEINLKPNSSRNYFILPRHEKDQVDSIQITGPQGCGKSTWIRDYIDRFIEMYPKYDIYLFSNKDKDVVFEDLEKEKIIERVKLDNKFLEMELELEDLSKSLCVWDDIEAISNKDIKKKLYTLKDNVQTKGRSYKINSIEANHVARSGKDTKIGLLEANGLVFFYSGQKRNTDILLKDYANLNKEQINYIKSIKSRWYYIHIHHPMYVVTEKTVLLL